MCIEMLDCRLLIPLYSFRLLCLTASEDAASNKKTPALCRGSLSLQHPVAAKTASCHFDAAKYSIGDFRDREASKSAGWQEYATYGEECRKMAKREALWRGSRSGNACRKNNLQARPDIPHDSQDCGEDAEYVRPRWV